MMKKIVAVALLLSLMALSLVGCTAPASTFSGEWRFSKIAKVEISPEASEEMIELYKEHYGVTDTDGLIASARADFEADGAFNACYIRFEGDRTYTYDPAMDREATWVFFKTAENEGFLSFYTEIDPSEVTPDPIVFPPVVYDAQANTLSMPMQYSVFIVTVELAK